MRQLFRAARGEENKGVCSNIGADHQDFQDFI
jgi:hypothetical protein